MMKTGVDARMKPREVTKLKMSVRRARKRNTIAAVTHADDTCPNVCNGRTGCHE